MKRINVFALRVDAIFGDEQKSVGLHRVLFQKAHVFAVIVCRDKLIHLLHFTLHFFIEIGVFFVAYLFGFAARRLDGQISYGEGVLGQNLHQIVIFPERKRLFDLFFVRFQHFRHRTHAKISVRILAEKKPVKIHLYGKPVRLGKVLCDEFVFDARVRVIDVFGKRTKSHSQLSVSWNFVTA